MPTYTLRIEDRCDSELQDLDELLAAIARLTTPRGPTFIVLSDPNGNYVQAGGTNDRYIAESREVYGEGFIHWAAGYPNCNDRSEAVVYYRNKCLKNEHPSRRCPLDTVNRRVLRFADIREILLHYYATSERSPAYAWDDISAKYQEPNPTSGDDPIKEIRPAWDRIHQAGEWP